MTAGSASDAHPFRMSFDSLHGFFADEIPDLLTVQGPSGPGRPPRSDPDPDRPPIGRHPSSGYRAVRADADRYPSDVDTDAEPATPNVDSGSCLADEEVAGR